MGRCELTKVGRAEGRQQIRGGLRVDNSGRPGKTPEDTLYNGAHDINRCLPPVQPKTTPTTGSLGAESGQFPSTTPSEPRMSPPGGTDVPDPRITRTYVWLYLGGGERESATGPAVTAMNYSQRTHRAPLAGNPASYTRSRHLLTYLGVECGNR